MTTLLHSKGSIDHIDLVSNPDHNKNQMVIQGWAFTEENLTFDSVEVWVGETRLDLIKFVTGIESPDVARILKRQTASKCRFVIETGLLPDDRSPDLDIVLVRLMVGEKKTTPLLSFPREKITEISDEEALPVGGGSEATSSEFLGHFIHLCELQPNEKVLDVGCGMGRIARAVSFYLNDHGLYRGFDIVKDWVDHGNEIISSKCPHFKFDHIDIHNHMYNPSGRISPDQVEFPYEDNTFDLINVSSVFTHMGSPETKRYIGEFSRVLKKGGRVLVTSFQLVPDAMQLIEEGKSDWNITHPRDSSCFVHNPTKPDVAVGFVPDDYFGWFKENELIKDFHANGSWCGRNDYFSYQDISIFSKR